MGNIVMAVCSNCNLESDTIYQGIGFRYFENGIRIEPAYCDACGVVVGRDISKNYCKCPKCRKKVKFYKEDMEESETEEQFLPPSDYLEEKEFWHCPRCKKDALQFQSMGLWD